MAETSIEWTDTTWNPVRGCSRVSDGCTNCYAMRQAHRFSNGPRNGKPQPFDGLTTLRRGKIDWTGEVRLVPSMIELPLRWRRPRFVFVNSMSDLFHESLSDEAIDRVWAVMWLGFWHTYQILTKRADRMRRYLTDPKHYGRVLAEVNRIRAKRPFVHTTDHGRISTNAIGCSSLPREWIWLGVSAEDQQRADERIPDLLATPAAVRFVSAEPLIGPITFPNGVLGCKGHLAETFGNPLIHWVIVGGESGPGARPCDLAWIRSIVEQCQSAAVACFVKQLGAKPYDELPPPLGTWNLANRKGGNPSEWPAELRVREFPRAST